MNPATSTVHVVDDDASFRTSMSRLLRGCGFVVKTFSSGEDFLAQLGPATAGCVIVDLHMPGLNGLELQKALVAAGNPIPLVFLTGGGDIPTTVHAMRLGAEDFLSKRATKEELLEAVNRALARDARLHELRDPFAALTPREREVLAHVLEGQLNKQIARDLEIDERSVKRHRTSITTKLRVQSVVELTHLVHQSGLSFSTRCGQGTRP